MMKETCFVGWDVGAWNCDKNKTSRDTLVVLQGSSLGGLRQVGSVWRGNLREDLTRDRGFAWIGGCCGENLSRAKLVIAVDTPLGWPSEFLRLVNGERELLVVDADARSNRQLFRWCERELFAAGFQPLSAVKDMIGSQSSKGIYFLNTRGFKASSPGIWKAAQHTAIETYPTPSSTSKKAADLVGRLHRERRLGGSVGSSEGSLKDTEDAYYCEVVAAMQHLRPSLLQGASASVDEKVLESEGWIWLPKDADSKRIPVKGAPKKAK